MAALGAGRRRRAGGDSMAARGSERRCDGRRCGALDERRDGWRGARRGDGDGARRWDGDVAGGERAA
uniref:Uncharacterized protein n=1 Tax=Oryza sativa subsp. japonica TaxID=39947 RepID=Q6K757_ORYSJ|nr:hypothetical protein [Oryza sativa Japonica Group]